MTTNAKTVLAYMLCNKSEKDNIFDFIDILNNTNLAAEEIDRCITELVRLGKVDIDMTYYRPAYSVL